MNGHGITTDFCFAESVLSLTLVRPDGEVIKCARDSAVAEHRELFKLCIGGYGLFGVIYDVTLNCNDNTRLSMDAMTVPIRDFTYVYDSVLKSGDEVEMKLSRIDTTTFETVDVFVFRRATAPGTNTGMYLLFLSHAAYCAHILFIIHHSLTMRQWMCFVNASLCAGTYAHTSYPLIAFCVYTFIYVANRAHIITFIFTE